MRQHGRFNQRHALLFRDYLRASPTARGAHGTVEARLAQVFTDCIDGYLFVEDPVMDLIYEAADHWASAEGWAPDDRFA